MVGTSVQTLDISPVGRVEGDLDVRVDIEDGSCLVCTVHAYDAKTGAQLASFRTA